MAYTSEIDKLERRHRENPEGRTFAPLADAYRKAGDVARALEVLKTGLQLHPDYLSASIVLGRCHLDLADLPSAEGAFQRVLDLDKENVIAIKALADITERLSRFDESEHWLNYLLSIDGSNEDARIQLQRLAVLREQQATMSEPDLESPMPEEAPAPAEDDRPPVAPTGWAKTVELAPVQTSPEARAEDPDLEEPAAEEPDAGPTHAAGFEPTAHREAERTEEVDAVRVADTVPVFGMDGSTVPEESEDDDLDLLLEKDELPERADTGMDLEREPDEVVSADAIQLDVGVERHEEIVLRPSSTSEYQVPSDAEVLARQGGGFSPRAEENPAPTPATEDMVDEPVTSEGLWQSHPEDAMMDEADVPVSGSEAPGSPADSEEDATLKSTEAWGAPTLSEDHAVRDQAEPVMTGADQITEDAKGEVRSFTSASPEPPAPPADEGYPEEEEEDLALRGSGSPAPVVTETIADLYAQQGHVVEALVVYRQLLLKSPGDTRLQEKIAKLDPARPAGEKPRGFAAAETGGQSVRHYFGDLLSTRLNDSANGDVGEETPSPLEESESEQTGFMEEAFRTDSDVPVSGEPTRPANGPLSLSAIFGEDSSPVPPVVSGPEHPSPSSAAGSSFDEFFGERPAAPASTTRTRSVRVDADQDDLDQFHKWLKGLKR